MFPFARKHQTTKTKAGIPAPVIRWWRHYGRYVIEAGKESMLAQAAAKEYEAQFSGRNFASDFDTVAKYESMLKGKQ